MVKTKILTQRQLVEWVHQLRLDPVVAILLGGERLSCCDEAIGVDVSGQIVSVATIAPKGEAGNGVPTIVALYTLPDFRRKEYSQEALIAAVARCRARGFTKVRVDVMSSYVMRIIEKLSTDDRKLLEVNYLGPILDRLA